MSKNSKTLILGIGNSILSDDATGIIVARKIYDELVNSKGFEDIEFAETAYAGWRLVDLIAGHKKIIIIDAIQGGGGSAGDCYKIEQSKSNSLHLHFSHGMDLFTALEFARKSGIDIPDNISIYAVEVNNPYEFGETISPAVNEKIPVIVHEIIRQEFPGGRKCMSGV